MLKKLNPTAKLIAMLIIVVVVIMVIIASISGNQVKQATPQYLQDNATADNKVEALKTVTSDLVEVQNKNKSLSQAIDQLKQSNQQTTAQLKNAMQSQLQQTLKQLQAENKVSREALEQRLMAFQKQQASKNENQEGLIGNVDVHDDDGDDEGFNQTDHHGFQWISDISKKPVGENTSDSLSAGLSGSKNSSANTSPNNSLGGITSLLHPGKIIAASHAQENTGRGIDGRKNTALKTTPYYTIPKNATLTGATLLTPLVGRIPLDGKLTSPYHFKAVLSANNLTANGYPLPGIKGAVVSGVASGDMLGRCARGTINSITFIFNDGTISTISSSDNDNTGEEGGLGYISASNGNPCINGQFHSNAGVFLAAQMALAGAEGYGNALSQAQLSNSVTGQGSSISTLIGSANQYAMGQSASSASQAAQAWWNQRVKNSFDYIYVPNVNPKTKQVLKVALNISQQINIDHNSKARKVSYEQQHKTINTELD